MGNLIPPASTLSLYLQRRSSSSHGTEVASLMVLGPVVQTLDSSIHRISIWETNCVTYWIEIYPADSAIHLLNNWGLVYVLVVFSMEVIV